MPQLLDLIRQAQALKLAPGSAAQQFVDDALNAVLLAEGPPPQPIDGLSENLRTDIARSPQGRIRFLAHTWITGPWTCLLLDLPPVPLGRPHLLKDKASDSFRVTVDWPSRLMQAKLRMACSSLGLPQPPEPSRFATAYAPHRTFIAWGAYSEQINTLRGDLDNYAKNVLDGLQRAGLIRNDKTVASLLAVNLPMPDPVRSLEEYLADHITSHLTAHPGDTPKRTAKALNYPTQRTERLFRSLSKDIANLRLNLIQAHLKEHPHLAKPSQIAKATGLATSTVSLLIPSLKRPANPPEQPQEALQAPAPAPRKLRKAPLAPKAPDLPPISNITLDLVTPHDSSPPPLDSFDSQLDDSNQDLIDLPPAKAPSL